MDSEEVSKVSSQRVLVLGGSRGLGLAVSGQYADSLVCSRKSEISIDLSKPESVQQTLDLVSTFKPDIIFYVAGGGPHGDFFSKPLHSHKWAYQVNYFSPLALAYELIEQKYKGVFVYIGSAIAERSNSNQSLSYSQSKKMAKESLLSIQENRLKIRIYSPPYMNTRMLTKNAWPRIEASDLVIEPDVVANRLVQWLEEERELPKRDSDVRHFDWLERFTYDIPEGREL